MKRIVAGAQPHDPEDIAVYAAQGLGSRLGLRPPLGPLMVDFVNGFADPAQPGGGNIGPAIDASIPVLAQARSAGWPVAHSRIIYPADGSEDNVFAEKIPGMRKLHEDALSSAIVPSLSPRAGELVVRKSAPSAFFGTGLAPWLTARGVSTLLIAGCTTSGCVRASVVDAMSWGFRPVVLADCVGDREIGPHDAALFDLQAKYADVRRWEDVASELRKPGGGEARRQTPPSDLTATARAEDEEPIHLEQPEPIVWLALLALNGLPVAAMTVIGAAAAAAQDASKIFPVLAWSALSFASVAAFSGWLVARKLPIPGAFATFLAFPVHFAVSAVALHWLKGG